jgi:hypothetical protein
MGGGDTLADATLLLVLPSGSFSAACSPCGSVRFQRQEHVQSPLPFYEKYYILIFIYFL